MAKVCHWFPGKRPSDYLGIDEQKALEVDVSLAFQLENERTDELELLFKTVLRAGGFEFKKELKPMAKGKDEPLPHMNLVLKQLMGKSGNSIIE